MEEVVKVFSGVSGKQLCRYAEAMYFGSTDS